jgi:sulfonate transport system permease protein
MNAPDSAVALPGPAGLLARPRAPALSPAWPRATRLARRLALPAAVLVVWQAASLAGLANPLLLPPPSDVAATLWQLTASGELPRHVAVSARRVLEGFALAAVAGLTLGIAMGLWRGVHQAADLFIQVVKPIPPIAWIPLAILWLGIGEEAKVFLIFIGALFPILVNTIDAIRQTDGRYVELARVFEVPRGLFIRQVVLPGALPQIMSGLRLGVNLSWMCVVAAELIAAASGVGYLIMDARQLSQTDVVLAGMLTMGVMGKLTDDTLRLVERRLVRWRPAFAGL